MRVQDLVPQKLPSFISWSPPSLSHGRCPVSKRRSKQDYPSGSCHSPNHPGALGQGVGWGCSECPRSLSAVSPTPELSLLQAVLSYFGENVTDQALGEGMARGTGTGRLGVQGETQVCATHRPAGQSWYKSKKVGPVGDLPRYTGDSPDGAEAESPQGEKVTPHAEVGDSGLQGGGMAGVPSAAQTMGPCLFGCLLPLPQNKRVYSCPRLGPAHTHNVLGMAGHVGESREWPWARMAERTVRRARPQGAPTRSSGLGSCFAPHFSWVLYEVPPTPSPSHQQVGRPPGTHQ